MASLEEPFVLSSYAIDGAEDAWKVEFSALVYAAESSDEVSAKSLGKKRTTAARSIAVHTVQRSGVHLVDLAEQAPLSSFTVSPTTVFTARAVAVSSPSTEESEASASTSANTGQTLRTRRTFAAVQQDGKYELWCWREEESPDGSAVGDPVKQTLALDSQVVSLDVASILGHLLVLLENGTAILLNFGLEEVAKLQLPTQRIVRTVSSVLSSVSLAGLGYTNASESTTTIAVAALSASNSTAATPKDRKSKRKSLPPASEPDQKASVLVLAVDPTTKQLATLATHDVADPHILDIALCGSRPMLLTLSKSGNLSTHTLKPDANVASRDIRSILSVKQASPVRLASSIQKSLALSPEKLNLGFGSILSLGSSPFPQIAMPFVLLACSGTSSAETVQILLVDMHYGLILAEQQIQMPGASSGRFTLAQLDADNAGLAYTPGKGKETGGAAAAKRTVVHTVPCSVPTQSSMADLIGSQALTQSYLPSNAAPVKANADKDDPAQKLLQSLQKCLGRDQVSHAEVKAAESIYRNWRTENKTAEGSQMTHSSVRQVLTLAIASFRPTQPVASEIVSSLVTAGLASDSSFPNPGLTAALVAKDEWSAVMICLHHLRDVPETSLVNALRLSCHTTKAAPHNVLRAVLKSPVTPAEMRKALRDGLGAEELEIVLHIIQSWLRANGDDAAASYGKAPSLDYLVPFTQAILDAHLVTMLQSRSLHPLLHSISASLYGHIELSASILSLRGPLAEISRIHQLQVQEEKERKARLKKLGTKPGKKPKKLKDDPEERWKAKKKSQENTMLVGDYALEEFLL